MTTKGAWHPKGVKPKARQLAEAAAKDAGIPVGKWIEAAILAHTKKTGTAPTPASAKLRLLPEAPAKKTPRPDGEGEPYTAPANPFQRKLRWLAAGSLVFLLFLVAAFGLFWVGERKGPAPHTAGDGADVKTAAGISAGSLKQIRTAAKTGDREAQFDLAMRYTAGEWVPKDDLAAADWFEKAALQGHVEAQYRLGLAYEAGQGVAKNLFEAFFWLQSAAEQGHVQAKFKTAVAYADGLGIEADPEKAAGLFGTLSEQGHPQAMRRLADLYETGGKGLAKDPEAAGLWRAAAEEVAALDAPGQKNAQIVVLEKIGTPAAPKAALDQEALAMVERLLTQLGFEPGPADGRITDETEAAIRLYQAFADLPVDGKPSQALLEDLRAVFETAGMPAAERP